MNRRAGKIRNRVGGMMACMVARLVAISARSVVPVAPYMRDMPYNIREEVTAPKRKYFSPPSLDLGSSLK